jgi:hypothetical protein
MRKDTTLNLKRAASYYFIGKGFAVHDEIGLKSSGAYSKLRADILAVNMKGLIVIAEIKSSWQDFISDTKWHKYVAFCDKMYFVITEELNDSKHGKYIRERAAEHGVGILSLSGSSVRVVKNARKQAGVSGEHRHWLMTKLAWRGGFSKASTDRTMRFDVTDRRLADKKLSILQFIGMCKSDRAGYLRKNPRCGYKKYLNYPPINTEHLM